MSSKLSENRSIISSLLAPKGGPSSVSGKVKWIARKSYVGKNLTMKRGRPRARGRFGRIIKPFSEITIKVRQLEEQA